MRHQFLGLNKTVFSNLEYLYKEILEVRYSETPRGELDHKKGREINAKITFHYYDGYLKCREIFEGSQLIEYYYDWYANNGVIIQKFHAHYHPGGTPDEITQFDPWHWHVPKNIEDFDGQRVPSIPGYSIHDVMGNDILPYILRIRRST
ncbi:MULTISPECIES: hypothetical protein [unclassified Paenibacillus]|uniref:hypothetical protein n=1 Tax=unclassified Paenibacillus TaxID=185978 RepID=UPI002407000F|nr:MULTISPECIES: hypothetical protein [unclassified Paenibacillus]MDF9840161.1 hypothetical protein [Paenibacillus sp. PastF-2]MDF9846743.1 hypothetical protein [Paenibacillus sp. PastM-2]MDF9852908.1 hypothetical protein [Paenibacillus sp. PastF-1]MDH6478587.1 hypothetical protein [Paenibacillus sp. PastH-2]MDH6505915.1 hypothetical protein [Paenibacillus sp. PastM-3]